MALIPKSDPTNEETVSQAKEALAEREAIEGKLKARLEGVEQNLKTQLDDAANASSEIYLAEASGVGSDKVERLRQVAAEKTAALDALEKERKNLTHACAVASSNSADARRTLTRVAFRSQINRVGKLLERLVGETVRLENSIETSVGHHRKILEHLDTLRASWPGGDLPPLEIFSNAGLSAAIQNFTFKVSAVIDHRVNVPITQYPGSRCTDMMLLGKPDALPSVSGLIDDARAHLMDVLLGKKDSRTGAFLPTAEPTETAAATPATV